MHHELDPFCMRIARQKLHPRRQLSALAATGPVVDTGLALTGGIIDLLCVARRVIVPMQTILCTVLLRRFLVCPVSGHWGDKRTNKLLQRSFYWPELGTNVKEWISMCPQCQEKEKYMDYGKLKAFEPYDKGYRSFKLHQITGLPICQSLDEINGQKFRCHPCDCILFMGMTERQKKKIVYAPKCRGRRF